MHKSLELAILYPMFFKSSTYLVHTFHGPPTSMQRVCCLLLHSSTQSPLLPKSFLVRWAIKLRHKRTWSKIRPMGISNFKNHLTGASICPSHCIVWGTYTSKRKRCYWNFLVPSSTISELESLRALMTILGVRCQNRAASGYGKIPSHERTLTSNINRQKYSVVSVESRSVACLLPEKEMRQSDSVRILLRPPSLAGWRLSPIGMWAPVQ